MKFYIPFGDWSEDGHGRYINVLVEAPSMEGLLEAQNKIKEKYGNDFFDHFATDYEDSTIGDNVYQALIDTNYTLDQWMRADGRENVYDSWEEFRASEDSKYISIDTIIDIFIWLLNAFGAKIKTYEDIPMICNWTCYGFETVGYGCFE